MSRSAWVEVSRAQRRASAVGNSQYWFGGCVDKCRKMRDRVETDEGLVEVSRYEYRQTRRRQWTLRVTALREFFPLFLRNFLAPSWARGAERARLDAAAERKAEAEFVNASVIYYTDMEADEMAHVSRRRRELEAASLKVRHYRERREEMELRHVPFIQAKLVASLVDDAPLSVERPIWTVYDERKGMSA